MSISIYSIIMAMMICSIWIIFASILRHKDRLIQSYGVSFIVSLSIICIVRMLFPLEWPTTIVLRDYTIYPILQAFVTTGLFQFGNTYNFFTIANALTLLYIMVVIIKFTVLVHRQIRFQKKVNCLESLDASGLDKSVVRICKELRISEAPKIIKTPIVVIPQVYGLLSKTILLPETEYTADEYDYILFHECTHIKNKDLWIKLLTEVFCILFWFNPVVYLLKLDLNQTLELKCDLSMAEHLSNEGIVRYMETIYKTLSIAFLSGSGKTIKNTVTTVSLSDMSKRKTTLQRFRVLASQPNHSKKSVVPQILTFCMILTFAASYQFVIQPHISPFSFGEAQFDGIDLITPGNSYVVKNADGSYNLFLNSSFFMLIEQDDIDDFMLMDIPVKLGG